MNPQKAAKHSGFHNFILSILSDVKKIIELNRYYHFQIPAEDLKTPAWSQVDARRQYH